MKLDTERSTLKLYLGEKFMLGNKIGQRLFQEVAKSLPIIDPHNHVDAAALAGNIKFENLYQVWVKPDQYKNRIMRHLGIREELITGHASDYEKYLAWAGCLQYTAGNPMMHWSCMELKSVFGIEEMLTPANAEAIWNHTRNLLQGNGFGALDIVRRLGVEMMCTSDDLLDSLQYHRPQQNGELSCLPSLRADSIIAFSTPSFESFLSRLNQLTGREVRDIVSYQQAVVQRLDFFDAAGCLLSDHSFDSGFRFLPTDFDTAAMLFKKILGGNELSPQEQIRLQSYFIYFLGKEYRKRSWKMQLHIGAQRFTSSRLRAIAGPAGGYACIGNTVDVQSLCLLLDSLDVEEMLPKTILYTLNPADNAVFASLTGSFSEDGIKGKIQFGPAWWFNDHHDGITQQLVTLASYGLLSTSIGMTTDSRSILSFLRHDYFRRILCNLIGQWAEEDKIPNDWNYLSQLVADISYHNCKNWLKK